MFRTMRAVLIAVIVIMCCTSPALANDGWDSQLPHFGGYAVLAGAATASAGYFGFEHRAMIGFGFSTTIGFIGETTYFSWLDVFCNVAGASVGAFVTDRYILTPVVATQQDSNHASNYLGLMLSGKF